MTQAPTTRCPRCRHDNPARAKFCLECSQRIALVCAACGAEVPDTAKFCMDCGRPVAATGAPSAAELAPAGPETGTPAAYTPRRVQQVAPQYAALAADARRAEGEALVALCRPTDGETLLRQTKAEALALDAGPAAWRACLALARLHEAAGRTAEAAAERAEARAWLERVAAGLADAPELRRAFEASEPFRAACAGTPR